MNNCNKPVRGIDWEAIFKRRPDLSPPGYDQLLSQIRQEQANDRSKRDSGDA